MDETRGKELPLMDKLLKMVYNDQFHASERAKIMCDCFDPFIDKLKEKISEKAYDEEFFCIFWDCFTAATDYCAVESMKMAIGIMDGTYKPYMV